jgi:hypothetical protein
MSQSITFSPCVEPDALNALTTHLILEGYSPSAIDAIVGHASREGCLDGAPRLDLADVDMATEAFIGGFRPVETTDPAWGSPTGQESQYNPLDDVATPNDTISLDGDDLVNAIDGPDAPDHHVTSRPGYWEALAVDGILPAISGGCDDVPPPYEPTPEDWAEYHRIFDAVDQAEVIRPRNNPLGLISRDLAEFLANPGRPLD